LSKWLKKLGDEVKRDEPLFEISTDKVDAEIPAPSAGVLAEIKVQEGQTVPVQTLVAVIETDKGASATAPPQQQPSGRPLLRGLPPRRRQFRSRRRRRRQPPRSSPSFSVLPRSPKGDGGVEDRRERLPPQVHAPGPQDRRGASGGHLDHPG